MWSADLTLRQQRLTDAVNLDDLNQMIEEGRPLSDGQQQILAELREKAQFRPKVPPE